MGKCNPRSLRAQPVHAQLAAAAASPGAAGVSTAKDTFEDAWQLYRRLLASCLRESAGCASGMCLPMCQGLCSKIAELQASFSALVLLVHAEAPLRCRTGSLAMTAIFRSMSNSQLSSCCVQTCAMKRSTLQVMMNSSLQPFDFARTPAASLLPFVPPVTANAAFPCAPSTATDAPHYAACMCTDSQGR